MISRTIIALHYIVVYTSTGMKRTKEKKGSCHLHEWKGKGSRQELAHAAVDIIVCVCEHKSIGTERV